MKKGILLAASLVVAGGIAADAQSITGDDVARMRDRFRGDPSVVAIQNVLTSNGDIRALALNHGLDGKVDHYFKYRVNVKGITDQKQSGRCWMFTSMNVLRPSVMEKYNLDEFDFSHNYLYFWDMLEKANLFLENVAATASKPMDDREVVHYFSAPLDDGGVWNLYYNLGEKYGVVPKEVMPETAHSNNTSAMGSLINERLRKGGYTIREMAAARFERQKHDRLGVYRLTLAFSHPVGEGFLAGHPDTLVTTRKARCMIDRLGFLVRCYPVLRG